MTFEERHEFEPVIEPAGLCAEPALPLHCASEPCTSADETALMARVGRGEVDAFAVIVERYTPQLYRVCRRMLNGGSEAEDVVQEAFVKLWQTAPQWRAQGGGLPAWLHRVAVNRCLDRLRQFRVITTDTLPDLADESPGPERTLAMRRLNDTVEEALASLPGRHRAAIVLCYFEGLSNILAAQVLELNLKAMESLLFRARRSLRELLEARGVRSDDLELLA